MGGSSPQPQRPRSKFGPIIFGGFGWIQGAGTAPTPHPTPNGAELLKRAAGAGSMSMRQTTAK